MATSSLSKHDVGVDGPQCSAGPLEATYGRHTVSVEKAALRDVNKHHYYFITLMSNGNVTFFLSTQLLFDNTPRFTQTPFHHTSRDARVSSCTIHYDRSSLLMHIDMTPGRLSQSYYLESTPHSSYSLDSLSP